VKDSTRYELPQEGTSLLGYIVRRMHKTELLLPVENLLKAGNGEQALARIALYTAASSTSYGRAYYQPEFNHVGDEIRAVDPATDWVVSAILGASSPHYVISYRVDGSNGAIFSGTEEITATTIGLHGLGMPAPSRFEFTLPALEYNAHLTGIITSELVLSLFGRTRIRAYGSLNAEDNLGNQSRLDLARNGNASLKLNNKSAELHSLLRLESGK
jgi:hypothetical protein